MAKEIVTSELQHGLGELGSVLPYWQVFKLVISHRGKQNYKLQQVLSNALIRSVGEAESSIWNL